MHDSHLQRHRSTRCRCREAISAILNESISSSSCVRLRWKVRTISRITRAYGMLMRLPPLSRTALHVAATVGDLEACKILIDAGAEWESHDHWGVIPIQDALRGGHDEIVAYLTDLAMHGYARSLSNDLDVVF